ncbi:hypothetical protein DAPPUDRAFT_306176 [Daphnia pulex]|uniref:Uncharacterized protein n=1 Tax=Daphnia pulex TaxID=6669 RepID=E9GVM5_DAPPU|nr:hypothetical protein DAPPUDRAFT_306176 [Daphnia pulex]|eukprot:EFX76439.1 hypothetical protein DAPPUDRAFT_306176 [Daphnia pulex]
MADTKAQYCRLTTHHQPTTWFPPSTTPPRRRNTTLQHMLLQPTTLKPQRSIINRSSLVLIHAAMQFSILFACSYSLQIYLPCLSIH